MKAGVRGLCVVACLAAVGILAASQVLAEMIPTTNLMVQLDGTSAAVGAGENAGKVQIWYDQAYAVGNENATQQDFGVPSTATANMPTMTTYAFATGLKPVLDFDRGTTTKNSSPMSDYLSSKTAGEARAAFGGTFTPGPDVAYDTVADGLSWFIVFQTDILTSTFTAASSTGRQSLFRTTSTNFTSDSWGSGVQDTGLDTDTNQVEAMSQVRSSTAAVAQISPNITSQWYILGSSWDPVSGAFQTVIYDETGATLSTTLSGTLPAQNADTLTHVMSRIGLLPGAAVPPGANSTSNAFDGRMAEILVYDTALDTTGMQGVTNYLKNKYFVPEPGTLILLSALALSGVLLRPRGR